MTALMVAHILTTALWLYQGQPAQPPKPHLQCEWVVIYAASNPEELWDEQQSDEKETVYMCFPKEDKKR